MNARSTLACATALAVVAAIPKTWAASDYFLKIEGIPGESRAGDTHKDWIELISFRWAGDTHSAAPSQARPNAGPGAATITKTMDATSARLNRACTAGETFDQVTLHVATHAGGDADRPRNYMEYSLGGVTLTCHGGVGVEPAEQLTLNFQKISMRPARAEKDLRIRP